MSLAPKTRSQPSTNSNEKPSKAITQAKHTKRKLAKSQTLMRPAVKKPHQLKNDIQAVKYTPKPNHVNLVRAARAGMSQRSPHISKFGDTPSNVIKSQAHLPVVPHNVKRASESHSSLSQKAASEFERLELALKDATSHMHRLEDNVMKTRFLKRVGFKNVPANLSAMFAAVLLLVGFFAYQNYAAISMKVAASKAGINAQLPSYKPAGYGIEGAIKSEPGAVSVGFKSRTDDKRFVVTQRSSNWNSTSLLANHVTKAHCGTCYQTWQNDGKTIYIYDNSNATWVSGGIWYQVEGDADLTSDQLLRLASSL